MNARSPLDVARTFLTAWASGDRESAHALLADDVAFESPMATLQGRDTVLAAMWDFGQAVQGIDVLAAVGDDERAVIVYDMHTGPFGDLRAAEHYLVRDGLIRSDQLVFDTYPVRSAAS